MQPVKLKVYRGSDDSMVQYGHFSEARRVKTGPDDDSISPGRIPSKLLSLSITAFIHLYLYCRQE